MPASCCRTDYDALFDERMARSQLAAYRRRGADRHTRDLIAALEAEGIEDATLLDIGGGIGAIQVDLLAAGAASSMDVDASHAYLAAARLEAERRGFGQRAAHRYGDFVELGDEVGPADVVTLDRVICCYPDMLALVGASVSHARRLYGLIYPVDRWWIRAAAAVGNLGLRVLGRSFRIHIHATRAVDELVRSHGFERRTSRQWVVWQMVVYRSGSVNQSVGGSAPDASGMAKANVLPCPEL